MTEVSEVALDAAALRSWMRASQDALGHRRADHQSDNERPALYQPRQPHGTTQVRGPGGTTLPQGWADFQLVAVLSRPAQPHAQRPGERRLGNTGVRARVTRGVTAPRPYRPPR